MKMKIFALILVALIAMLSFASCDDETTDNGGNNNGGGGNQHQHTFSENWSSNATKHWHQATCEHGEIKDGNADHVDADEDGKCDVCNYEVGHTHSFATTWSYDESNHWRAATCSHKDEKKAISLHTDNNEDGTCDICKGHVHVKGPAGICIIEGCGKALEEIDKSNLAGIINAVVNQGSLVNGTYIKLYEKITSNNEDKYDSANGIWKSYNTTNEETINVTFGKNGYVNRFVESTITKGKTEAHYSITESTYESWYEIDGKEVFGVASENGADVVRVTANSDHLLGNLFSLSDIASGYGTENFLYSLYEASQGENVKDFVIEIDEDSSRISFSFSILAIDKIEGTEVNENENYNPDDENSGAYESGDRVTSYYVQYVEVELSFTYNELFVITSLDASCKVYKNNAGQLEAKSENVKDVNLKYDPVTGEVYFVKYDASYTSEDGDNYRIVDKSEVTPASYSYSVTQTVGDRTAENEYSKSYFTPKSFDIFSDVDKTQKIEGTIEGEYKKFIYIYFGNYQPAGASIDYVFDLIDFTILDSKGNPIEGTDAMDGDSTVIKTAYVFDENGERHIFVYPLKTGKYTIVITYNGKIAHQVAITVK